MRWVSGPPEALVASLVEGPSLVSGVAWHDEVPSTQAVAVEAAAAGVPEIHMVLADVQTAGRGRRGRSWWAPAGTSLLASCVLRPRVRVDARPLVSLLAGLALVEVVDAYCAGAALKWPNDVLVDGRKVAGILAEAPGEGAVVLGMGVNVDWRGVRRPDELGGATSMAEAAGSAVDRWRLLAAFAGVFGNRYLDWQEHPSAFLGDYRARCVTVGQTVRAVHGGGEALVGHAVGIADDGALRIADRAGAVRHLAAGDVEHVRQA